MKFNLEKWSNTNDSGISGWDSLGKNEDNYSENSMKVYDKNLNLSENKEWAKQMEDLAQDEVMFIEKKYPEVDTSALRERYAACSLVDWKMGETFYVIEDGEKKGDYLRGDNAAAFVVNSIVDTDKGLVNLPFLYSNKHNRSDYNAHEMFHVLSAELQPIIEESDKVMIAHDPKMGLLHSDPLLGEELGDDSIYSEMDEAVTQLLARQFGRLQKGDYARNMFEDREIVSDSYLAYTDIADILINEDHYDLLKAYFGDENDMKNWEKDFEDRQSFVSSREIACMNNLGSEFLRWQDGAKINVSGFVNERLLVGCVEYALSFYDGNELENEWQRVMLLVHQVLQRNIKVCKLDDMILEYENWVMESLDSILEEHGGGV